MMQSINYGSPYYTWGVYAVYIMQCTLCAAIMEVPIGKVVSIKPLVIPWCVSFEDWLQSLSTSSRIPTQLKVSGCLSIFTVHELCQSSSSLPRPSVVAPACPRPQLWFGADLQALKSSLPSPEGPDSPPEDNRGALR